MKKVFKFWKIILFDTVGVALMVAALLTGWLPGPGGIPLFIIGLSILAIHHEWAEKMIDRVKDIVENIGEKIFNENSSLQVAYDIIGPILLAAGILTVIFQTALWQVSIGVVCCFAGLTLLLGNRKRYHRLKNHLKHKN